MGEEARATAAAAEAQGLRVRLMLLLLLHVMAMSACRHCSTAAMHCRLPVAGSDTEVVNALQLLSYAVAW